MVYLPFGLPLIIYLFICLHIFLSHLLSQQLITLRSTAVRDLIIGALHQNNEVQIVMCFQCTSLYSHCYFPLHMGYL